MAKFQRVILDENVSCPRCNARGYTHVREERGDVLIIKFYCPKCKLDKHVGITSRAAIKLSSQIDELENLLTRPDVTRYRRAQIEASIRNLKSRKNAMQLGLGGN